MGDEDTKECFSEQQNVRRRGHDPYVGSDALQKSLRSEQMSSYVTKKKKRKKERERDTNGKSQKKNQSAIFHNVEVELQWLSISTCWSS